MVKKWRCSKTCCQKNKNRHLKRVTIFFNYNLVCPFGGQGFFVMIDQLTKDLEFAKDKILQNRLLSWSSVSEENTKDKIALLQLTGKAWVDLQLVNNKFVAGGIPTDEDVLQYLWRNCVSYNAKSNRKTYKAKKNIGYIFGKAQSGYYTNIVYKHVSAAFEELPKGIKVQSSRFSRSNQMEAVSGIVSAIDEVAARYGQNPLHVLTWPLNRIFQLQKAIRVATIPDYKLAEPEVVRLIKKEILQQINNGTES